jgi:hypothetical protein
MGGFPDRHGSPEQMISAATSWFGLQTRSDFDQPLIDARAERLGTVPFATGGLLGRSDAPEPSGRAHLIVGARCPAERGLPFALFQHPSRLRCRADRDTDRKRVCPNFDSLILRVTPPPWATRSCLRNFGDAGHPYVGQRLVRQAVVSEAPKKWLCGRGRHAQGLGL